MSALRPVTKLVTKLIGSRVTCLEGLARRNWQSSGELSGGVELLDLVGAHVGPVHEMGDALGPRPPEGRPG